MNGDRNLRISPSRRALNVSLPVVAMWFLFLVATPAVATVSCSARLDRHTAVVGEQVVLTLDVEGDVRTIEDPHLPDFGPFEVYGGGESQRFSFVNGQVHTSHSYTWYLRPLQAGEFELPPIEVLAGGKTYRTRKIPLSVSAAKKRSTSGTATPGNPAPGNSSPGTTTPPGSTPGSSGRASSRPASPASASGSVSSLAGGGAISRGGAPGDDFFVTMSVDRDTVVVGEQVILTFSFYRGIRGSIFNRPQYSPPATEGFWREDLPPERHDTVTLQGESYEVTSILYALFPTRTGSLEVGEAVVRIPEDTFGSFFRQRRRRGNIVLRAPALPLAVRSLPSGAPSDFSGTVAAGLKLKIETDRQNLQVGDALTVALDLSGRGYLASAGKPHLPKLDAFREHDSGSSLDSKPMGGQLLGKLRVESLLIPQKAGDYQIPAVHYSYFDTDQRRYLTLSTRPVTIRVAPSDQPDLASFSTGGKSEIEILGQDILHIQPITAQMRPYRGPMFLRTTTWILAAMPVLIWLASSVFLRRRQRLLADPRRLQAQKALRNARRRLQEMGDPPQRASEALMVWMADKSGRPAAGLTRSEFARWLAGRGISENLRAHVEDFLDRADRARFAASGGGEELVEEASRLLELLEKEGGSD